MSRPDAAMAGAEAAHVGLLGQAGALEAGDAARPSLLPGWTVGHVLTHLCRNADSFTGVLLAAGRGEVGRQYPGGARQREDDIEAGAGRTTAAIVADLREATGRLEATWAAVADEVWQRGRALMFSGPADVSALPGSRWREVEVHRVDLGLGYERSSWPGDFVDNELDRWCDRLGDRLPPGLGLTLEATDTGARWAAGPEGADVVVVRADRRRLLAWLLGRGDEPGFPALAPWQTPAPPEAAADVAD